MWLNKPTGIYHYEANGCYHSVTARTALGDVLPRVRNAEARRVSGRERAGLLPRVCLETFACRVCRDDCFYRVRARGTVIIGLPYTPYTKPVSGARRTPASEFRYRKPHRGAGNLLSTMTTGRAGVILTRTRKEVLWGRAMDAVVHVVSFVITFGILFGVLLIGIRLFFAPLRCQCYQPSGPIRGKSGEPFYACSFHPSLFVSFPWLLRTFARHGLDYHTHPIVLVGAMIPSQIVVFILYWVLGRWGPLKSD